MPVQSTNTMTERLQKMLRDIADMRLAEDADPEYLDALRGTIEARLKAPVDSLLAGQSTAPMPGMPGPATPPVDPLLAAMGGAAGPDLLPDAGGPMGAMGAMGVPGGGGLRGGPFGGVPTPGAGVPGLRTEPRMPPVDELRRMLGG